MVVGPAAAIALLQSLEAALKAYVAALHEELQDASRRSMPTSGQAGFRVRYPRKSRSLLDVDSLTLSQLTKRKKRRHIMKLSQAIPRALLAFVAICIIQALAGILDPNETCRRPALRCSGCS